MPYPVQVTSERILDTARALIASDGAAALSLGKLAAALGIKPPSLYRYFASKEALIRTLNEQTTVDLFAAMAEGARADADSVEARLIAIAQAYRRFAHAHPDSYVLAMTTAEDAMVPSPTEQEQRALIYQAILAEWCGEARSLMAIRGLLALMHGYVMLEIKRQFRRSGGDLDATYTEVVRAFLAGLRT